MLRNVGIFGDFVQFETLKNNLESTYSHSELDSTKVKSLLYLVAYYEVVKRGPNEMIDQDDLLHFLLVLVRCPILMQQHQTEIKEILTHQLTLYIQELILEQGNYEMYMLLMPE